jgi:hypothetical protein
MENQSLFGVFKNTCILPEIIIILVYEDIEFEELMKLYYLNSKQREIGLFFN